MRVCKGVCMHTPERGMEACGEEEERKGVEVPHIELIVKRSCKRHTNKIGGEHYPHHY